MDFWSWKSVFLRINFCTVFQKTINLLKTHIIENRIFTIIVQKILFQSKTQKYEVIQRDGSNSDFESVDWFQFTIFKSKKRLCVVDIFIL